MLWIGFALAVLLLLVLSRRGLGLALASAAAALAAFTLAPAEIGAALWHTVADPSVLLLALVVSLIPVLGAAMEISGQMGRLVDNLRVGVRSFLVLAPGLLGMLPMPGGALLSAPLVERRAGHVPADMKAAANVWFRHVLLLVYPLGSSLLASAKVAGLDVYAAIPFLSLPFVVALALGVAFLLRHVGPTPRGDLATRQPFSLRGLLGPLALLLVAPAVDLMLTVVLRPTPREIATVAGVATSLGLSMVCGHVRPRRLVAAASKARPWAYAAIILAMFVFLNVFAVSGVPQALAGLRLSPLALCVGAGVALGFVTGRIEAPLAIVLPIYASSYGQISLPGFAVAYCAAFLGYIATPVHPCVSVSVAYFHTSIGALGRRLAWPAAVGVALTLIAGAVLL